MNEAGRANADFDLDDEDEPAHTCATGAATADDGGRPPHPIDLAIAWRRYQELAIAHILEAAQRGERRLQLVAPPGSGKTLMGLYVALALGRPIIALANTRAIAEQWRATLIERGLDLEGRFGGKLADRVASELPGDDDRMPLLLATTYQAFTRQRATALQRGDAAGDRLAPELVRLHARYGRAEPLLLLDECHHLTAWWSDAIAALLEAHPGCVVLGLTATPPEDASAEERRRFARLVGPVTHEIPLVGAVREQALAPFRDLALFVRPEEAAEQAIAGAEGRWSAWLSAARDSVGDEPAAWLPGLLHHVRSRCTVTPGRRDREETDFLSLCDREPDFAIALCRYLVAQGEELPAEVFPVSEMAFAPTRRDWLDLVDDYVVAVLGPTAAGHDRPAAAEAARERLAALGDALSPRGIRVSARGLRGGEDDGDLGDLLAGSRTRIVGMLDVLRHEWGLLGSEICAAVICDFVRTAAGGHGGRQEDDAPFVPGAIGAWRAIVADAELVDLLPILATGEEKWIPAACLPWLRDRLGARSVGLHVEALSTQETGGAGDGDYLRVRLPNHEGALLRALTGLLERDHAHCIVGTRVLLGEGWDCRALDTLVDLTSARSHVAVNQLRGRALRLDPERPEKIAHLWDVVTVPAIAAGRDVGLADLRRFLSKHQRFHAPAIDGELELGAGHVHPALRGGAEEIVGAVDLVGAELWELSRDRRGARERWRIGRPVGDDALLEVRFAEPAPLAAEPTRPQVVAKVLQAAQLAGPRHEELRTQWRRRAEDRTARRVGYGAGAAMLLAGVAIPLLGAAAGLGVTAALAGAGMMAWVGRRDLQQRKALAELLAGMAAADVEAAVARVTLQAASAAGKRLREVRVAREVAPDGRQRFVLRGSDATGRARLAMALEQALAGCPAPHHALEVSSVRPGAGPSTADTADVFTPIGLVPVPAALGTSRKMAEAFADAWRAEIGPCRLVAVRRERASETIPWVEAERSRWLRASLGQARRRELLEG